jgi:hypothetical protein
VLFESAIGADPTEDDGDGSTREEPTGQGALEAEHPQTASDRREERPGVDRDEAARDEGKPEHEERIHRRAGTSTRRARLRGMKPGRRSLRRLSWTNCSVFSDRLWFTDRSCDHGTR